MAATTKILRDLIHYSPVKKPIVDRKTEMPILKSSELHYISNLIFDIFGSGIQRDSPRFKVDSLKSTKLIPDEINMAENPSLEKVHQFMVAFFDEMVK